LCLCVGSSNAFAPTRPAHRGVATTFLQESAEASSEKAAEVDTPPPKDEAKDATVEASAKEEVKAEEPAAPVETTASDEKQETEKPAAEEPKTEEVVAEKEEPAIEEKEAEEVVAEVEEPAVEEPAAPEPVAEEEEPEAPKLKGDGVEYYKRPVIVKSVEEKKEIEKTQVAKSEPIIIVEEPVKKKGEGVVYYTRGKTKPLEAKDLYSWSPKSKEQQDKALEARKQRPVTFALKSNQEKAIKIKNLDRAELKKKKPKIKKVVLTREQKSANKKALLEAKKARQGKFILKKNEDKAIKIKNLVESKPKVESKKKKVVIKKKNVEVIKKKNVEVIKKKKVEAKKPEKKTSTDASKPRSISATDLLDARAAEPALAGEVAVMEPEVKETVAVAVAVASKPKTAEKKAKKGFFSSVKEKVLVPPLFNNKKNKK